MGAPAHEAAPSSSSSSSGGGSEGYGLPRRGGRAAAMNVQLSADETCECSVLRGGFLLQDLLQTGLLLCAQTINQPTQLQLHHQPAPHACFAALLPPPQMRTLCPYASQTRCLPTCLSCVDATTYAPSASFPTPAAASAAARWSQSCGRCAGFAH